MQDVGFRFHIPDIYAGWLARSTQLISFNRKSFYLSKFN